jgi:2-C-methyl-D-erythritol 4-phosphate cytidylyltransferase / 2-C-methyl-D-erythritol 2,4-cyclodiphosphate synthase
MNVGVIIVAAGRGARFGGSLPKQLVQLGGRSILQRSVDAFDRHPAIAELVVVLPEEFVHPGPSLVMSEHPCQFVAGGVRRQDSVRSGYAVLSKGPDVVLVHDAARPFVSSALIDRVISAALDSGAAVPCVPARDTVKRVDASRSVVAETLPRGDIWLAQTPQGFRRRVLEDALALGDDLDATDDASLAERAGHVVRVVEGDAGNIKITLQGDVAAAEALAGSTKPARTGRVGTGYDLHRLVEGRPLILGGVTIPFERGLAGHSDADAVCHAITDAILGAAGAGDIGRHFPDSDARWKGASSLDLLSRATAIVREGGLEVGNVDATIIAERPKLAPFIDAMRANLCAALSVSVDRVSLKGKTNEGVGELGRGEAIAVHAIALVRSAPRT